ncbi:MAG: penicillin-binding protein 2 [Coriobacteriia bacterium]|nr:penicillin-binding protein 2 [Coriobacteriia bacterium]
MPTFRHRLKPRFAVFGGVLLLLLLVLALRLWSMQVLSGPVYAAQADQNRVREVTTVAARGRILDRNGRELVTNRPTHVVLAPSQVAEDEEMMGRLSNLLKVSVPEIRERLLSRKEAALSLRVIAVDVPLQTVAYLSEHASEFPGVEVDTRAIREYPNKTLASHVLGYTGEISREELAKPDFAGYDPNDIVGKAGAERSFENALQGDRGRRVMEVDAMGRSQRIISEVDPVPGRDIRLTIDSRVQRVAEKALKDAMQDAKREKFYRAKAGAIVALDVKSGEVLAMASLPTYDPSVFLGGISEQQWRSLTSTSSEYPLTNRAMMAQYPPASTFKAFTGLAGLTYGVTGQWTMHDCEGTWTGMGTQWKKRCWNRTGHGMVSFMDGIEESCDTVFYEIGHSFYKGGDEKLQSFIRSFGYGSMTGIDLPGEVDGRVPDKAWKKAWNEDYPEYQGWNPGDTVNMAIGQGDVLATPLQVATTFGGIANNGKVMRPHVLRQILGTDGKPVLTVKPEVEFAPKVSRSNLDIMEQALLSVTRTGTGRSAFNGFRVPIAGKTGTAEVANKDDYAWFVGYGPAAKPRYVVAVVVEQGGGGGAVAAPAARQVLAALLGEKIERVTATDPSR